MTDNGPLSGIRVLDLSGYIAAPYGCTLLADQGADVIKIEPPGGDNLRKYPSTLQAEGRAFLGVNRGKSGIVLDLKLPQGREILHRLLRDADVLVHNFRPGVPERLGIDYETLSALNPRIICCAVTGYGETGPLRDKAGYDQVLQSMTGICALQGSPEDPQIVYGSVVDYYAAALLAGGVASALYQRERTGKGQWVGISLLRSALAMQSARFVWAADEPRDVYRDMRSGGITGLHATRAGSLYISANTAHFWSALCELIGLPELAADPRYDSVRKRAEHAAELVPQSFARHCRRTARWSGRPSSANACRAPRRGRSRTCSTIRRCWPKESSRPSTIRRSGAIGACRAPSSSAALRKRCRVRHRRSASIRTRSWPAWATGEDEIAALRAAGVLA